MFVTLIKKELEGSASKTSCASRFAAQTCAMLWSVTPLLAQIKLVVLVKLQLLLYLCANNRELRTVSERTEPIVKRDPAGLPNTRDHIEDWTAGWSTGIDFEPQFKQNGNSTSQKGPPVFRRAHWHPYWFGPRSKERVRELR